MMIIYSRFSLISVFSLIWSPAPPTRLHHPALIVSDLLTRKGWRLTHALSLADAYVQCRCDWQGRQRMPSIPLNAFTLFNLLSLTSKMQWSYRIWIFTDMQIWNMFIYYSHPTSTMLSVLLAVVFCAIM